jgi:hypothetical protein
MIKTLTLKEAAAFLQIHPSTLSEMANPDIKVEKPL